MKEAWTGTKYYYPHPHPRTYRVYFGWSSRTPRVTNLSMAQRERLNAKGDFPLSALVKSQWASAGKSSHMCLPAPSLGSAGRCSAVALITFPWSLPNLRDWPGEVVRECMSLPPAPLRHKTQSGYSPLFSQPMSASLIWHLLSAWMLKIFTSWALYGVKLVDQFFEWTGKVWVFRQHKFFPTFFFYFNKIYSGISKCSKLIKVIQ